MGFVVTPRNTTTAAVTQGSGHLSETVTLSPTSTVAGDLCVVAIASEPSPGTATLAWTPPSGAGFTQVLTAEGSSNAYKLSVFASNTVPAGTTSLAFLLTISGTGTSVFGLTAVYGCWPGANSTLTYEGGVVVQPATLGGTGLPSVTTGTETYANDLGIWAGISSAQTAPPTNPSGTGTWTSVASSNGAAAGRPSIRMSAQIGGSGGTTQTASGSTTTSASVAAVGIIGFRAVPEVINSNFFIFM